MNKSILFYISTVLIALTLVTSKANAQFVAQKNYLGPSVGFAFLGSTPDFGLSYEYGIELQNFGLVGVGGLFRYWGYSTAYWKYSDVLIGAQGNYHFIINGSKFDPYVGIVLAYDAGSVTWDGPYGEIFNSPTYGGLWLAIQGGARYWVSPTVAINGRLGLGTLGYSGLDFGVDFKF